MIMRLCRLIHFSEMSDLPVSPETVHSKNSQVDAGTSIGRKFRSFP